MRCKGLTRDFIATAYGDVPTSKLSIRSQSERVSVYRSSETRTACSTPLQAVFLIVSVISQLNSPLSAHQTFRFNQKISEVFDQIFRKWQTYYNIYYYMTIRHMCIEGVFEETIERQQGNNEIASSTI